MGAWAFILADASGETHDLADITSRSLSFRLHEADEARFTVDGRDPQAAHIAELTTDLVVYRHDVKVFHGRIGHTTTTLSPDRHSVSVVAHSYRAMLERRLLHADSTLTFMNVDQADIAWQLIADTQTKPGGHLGIWRDAPATGVLRTRTYEPGKTVLETVDQLAQVVNGFEWRVTPDRAFQIGYPKLGDVRSGVFLDYPGALASVTRAVTPGEYANVVRVTGSDAVAAEVRTQPDVAARSEGRWEKDVSAGVDITRQSTLAERADWVAAEHGTLLPGYHVTLQEGAWGGPNVWFRGDTVRLQIKSGGLTVDRPARVMDVNVALSDDDAETVSADLDGSGFRADLGSVDLSRRVARLERR